MSRTHLAHHELESVVIIITIIIIVMITIVIVIVIIIAIAIMSAETRLCGVAWKALEFSPATKDA